jgi:[ribosomal protein S18]-alanine N-acetyltransferase
MNIKLRLATSADIIEIMHLESLGFQDGIKEEKDTYLQRMSIFPAGCLLGIFEKEIIGCLFAELWEPKKNYSQHDFELGHDIRASHKETGEIIYISSITINPLYRNRGYGNLLFNESIKFISNKYPKVKELLLLVNENWHFARKIYKNNKFLEIKILENFFHPLNSSSENGIVMKRALLI